MGFLKENHPGFLLGGFPIHAVPRVSYRVLSGDPSKILSKLLQGFLLVRFFEITFQKFLLRFLRDFCKSFFLSFFLFMFFFSVEGFLQKNFQSYLPMAFLNESTKKNSR